MNRTALCIKMLQKLKTQNVVSTKEMAEFLETNPRNIREYRRELENAGYRINEVRGRYGGYTLDDRTLLPSPKLTARQVEVLNEGREYLNNHPDFLEKNLFEQTINQIIASQDQAGSAPSEKYIGSFYKAMSEKEKQMLETAQNALKERHVLKLKYQGRDKDVSSEVLVDPYHIVNIDGAWYMVGYSRTARNYRNYRFSDQRMMEIEDTGEPFLRAADFNLENYIGTSSAFKDRLVKYRVAVSEKADRLFNEIYWGTDFQLAENGKDWKFYTFFQDNESYVFSQLFSLGAGIVLVAPEEKRDKFARNVEQICERYAEVVE